MCERETSVIHTHTGILFSCEKGYPPICEKTDELKEHYTKCWISQTEKAKYGIIYMWKSKIFKLRENRVVPASGWGVGKMGRCWSKVKEEIRSGNLMCNLVITANITVVYIWKLLRVRRSNQSILKEINSEHSLGRCWSWSSNTLATWREELTHWKRSWCSKRLKAGEEGDNRGWDGWMASLIQWTRVWTNSRGQWRTGKSGVLQSTGLQRVRHDWVTEQESKT